MAKELTTAAVERLRPTGKRRWIRDAQAKSLYLVIQPSGAKSWAMRFRRPDGKPGKLVLGELDMSGHELKSDPVVGQPLSLVAARALAASIHRDRARGVDVIAEHKARRHRQRAGIEQAADNSFGVQLRKFITEHAMAKTRQWHATALLLGLYYPVDGGDPMETKGGLAQRWGDRPVQTKDGHDIHEVIDEARRVAVPGRRSRNKGNSDARARALHSALSAFFGWLLRHRKIAANPCTSVWRPKPSEARDRVLNESEIRWLWKATEVVPPAYGSAVKLLLLTGCRLNEVCGMRRDELGEDGIWLIPGQRTKNRRAHKIWLSPLAREVIASVPRIEGAAYIFSTNGASRVRGWSNVKAKLDAAMLAAAQQERDIGTRIPAWRLHDLRRTVVTHLAEMGIRGDVIELMVNHTSGVRAGIAGIYNKSELMSERIEALERWSAHIAGLVSGQTAVKVVKLKRGR